MLVQDAVHTLSSRSGHTRAGCAGQTTFSERIVRHGSSGQHHVGQDLN